MAQVIGAGGTILLAIVVITLVVSALPYILIGLGVVGLIALLIVCAKFVD